MTMTSTEGPVRTLGCVLVTGAQGFLGRHTVAALLEDPTVRRVIGIGRSPRSSEFFTYEVPTRGRMVRAPLPPELRAVERDARYCYLQADLRSADEIAEVLAQEGPDVVIHCAAALRDESFTELVESNVHATAALYESLAAGPDARRRPRVVFVSSGSVYGISDGRNAPRTESDPCEPLDLYAATKRFSEDLALISSSQVRAPTVVARVFNLLGPGLQPRHFASKVVHLLADHACGATVRDIPVGRLDTVRDFIDVRDAAEALVVIARDATPGKRYNVASGVPTVMRAVLDHLIRLTAEPPPLFSLPPRALDVPALWADVAALHNLCFRTLYGLEKSLADMFSYARSLADAPQVSFD
jgi:GDP-4-dehydro-6-deoxy-D-mannose reductase